MKDEYRKQTEQKLIKFGKAEFLEKGYVKANLRDICMRTAFTSYFTKFMGSSPDPKRSLSQMMR